MEKNLKLEETAIVHCHVCTGNGWVARYHNETETCSRCKGTGVVKIIVPIAFEELCFQMDEEDARILKLIHLYTTWSKK